MSGRLWRLGVLVLLAATVTTPAWANPADLGAVDDGGARFGRGMTGVVESPLALSDTVVAETSRLGAVRGVPVGLVKGVGRTIGRQATGVADMVGALGNAEPAWEDRGQQNIITVADGPSLRVGGGNR